MPPARLDKPQLGILPTGSGSALRYVFAGVIHDASQPATMRMEDGKGPKLAACK